MLKWRVNVLDELREAGWYPHKMRVEKLFGEASIQKLRRDKLLSWAEFDRLCKVLCKQPGDLLEWVPNDGEEDKRENVDDISEWYKPSKREST